MIKKDKYLVYDPKTDTLDLDDNELNLIDELVNSPEIRYERLLTEYFDKSVDKSTSFERLDEITLCYYNFIKSYQAKRVPVPFLTSPQSLEKIIEILEEKRESIINNQDTFISLNQTPTKGGSAKLTLQNAMRDKRLYEYLVSELSKPERGKWFDDFGHFVYKNRNVKVSIVVLIDTLIKRKYFKEEIVLSTETKIELIKNTFGIALGPRTSTFKKSDGIEKFAFLKHADTLLNN
jgi:hypothetical protein